MLHIIQEQIPFSNSAYNTTDLFSTRATEETLMVFTSYLCLQGIQATIKVDLGAAWNMHTEAGFTDLKTFHSLLKTSLRHKATQERL